MICILCNTESRVFIFGPAGSGKELVARQIHKKSLRSGSPFVVVNGALLDPEKYELENKFELNNTSNCYYRCEVELVSYSKIKRIALTNPIWFEPVN